MYMEDRGRTLYGRALLREVIRAQKHYIAQNEQALHVFPHVEAGLIEGIMGGIMNSNASKWFNPMSYKTSLTQLYHLFVNKKYLPHRIARRIANSMDVGPGLSIDGPFGIFNKVRDVMDVETTKELDVPERIARVAAIFHNDLLPLEDRLIALNAHMADAMTLHSPETLAALPYGGLHPMGNGSIMFANPEDYWAAQVKVSAHFMRDILCQPADLFGKSYVYRRIRDLAAQHLYPDIHKEVTIELANMEHEILRTNLFVERVLKETIDASESQGMTICTYSRNQDSSRKHDESEDERKSRGSITDKIAKERAKGNNVFVRDIHDLIARMVRTETVEEVYFAVDKTIAAISQMLGSQDIKVMVLPVQQKANSESEWPADVDAVIERMDYIDNPKKETGYQSYHIDVIFRKRLLMVNFEIISRTEEMHKHCDEGGAAHHMYKNGKLRNGLLLAFKRFFQEAMQGGSGVIPR